MFDLRGKVAVVTGGNGGIGLAMAKGLAQAGAAIAIIGRNAAKNEAACAELRQAGCAGPLALAADIRNESGVAEALSSVEAAFGGLDIVVNNVGANNRKPPEEYSLAEWNELIAVNLTTAFVVSQQAYPRLRARGGGKILNVGSMLSLFGTALCVPYAAAKGGVVQMTKSLAQAWARDDIQVNAILPGWINTELAAAARVQIAGLDRRVLERTPAGRWGEPDDLAGAAVFLCSDEARFVTGVALPVDGGFSSSA